MEGYLLEDIVSNQKGKKQYGIKGQKVKVISTQKTVIIVESSKERFSIQPEQIKIIQ